MSSEHCNFYPVKPCKAEKIDIVWCQDSSGSIGPENYEFAKKSIDDVLGSFDINDGDAGTKVGIYIFGTNAILVSPLTGNKTHIKEVNTISNKLNVFPKYVNN
jgi:hypothetical protein